LILPYLSLTKTASSAVLKIANILLYDEGFMQCTALIIYGHHKERERGGGEREGLKRSIAG